MGYADWQLNGMFEAESARIWEEKEKEDSLDRSWVDWKLSSALDALMSAYDFLADATDKAEGHAEGARIGSVLDEVDKLETEIRRIRKRLGVAA